MGTENRGWIVVTVDGETWHVDKAGDLVKSNTKAGFDAGRRTSAGKESTGGSEKAGAESKTTGE